MINKEKFDVNYWIQVYRNVQEDGEVLKNHIKGESRITLDEKNYLEDKIKNNLNDMSHYLDKCKIPRPKILWIYDKKDDTTHKSSKNFKYAHLEKRIHHGKL